MYRGDTVKRAPPLEGCARGNAEPMWEAFSLAVACRHDISSSSLSLVALHLFAEPCFTDMGGGRGSVMDGRDDLSGMLCSLCSPPADRNDPRDFADHDGRMYGVLSRADKQISPPPDMSSAHRDGSSGSFFVLSGS